MSNAEFKLFLFTLNMRSPKYHIGVLGLAQEGDTMTYVLMLLMLIMETKGIPKTIIFVCDYYVNNFFNYLLRRNQDKYFFLAII